ncbi:bifunctional folylpolyglutamate synthase/dihydrofolate synthase [Rhodopseudomonas palustris]|uniref:Dihydrofolate synthase/folylpolyglutamate synthase n=1 Tax=Rhodopseudomonas palustris TaxID=1076 RepID=A0A418VIT0_RHOPL|nr:folylpolyglutamate synthase/dihydrofolate synthase family protein [Rhodopseudomonas palustris]RJF76032.1 bifunctional folylpolyglutamate synthase/dihydrofolate synthase [Rhodopseudomonas palustris]
MSAATDPQRSGSVGELRTRLAQLHPARIDLTLGRVERLLAALDHPERKLPPVIHIAGTNGKGSTLAFLRAILEAAGLAVHAYTSPHLVRVNETIRLGKPGGGVLVSDDELAAALAHCERVNGGAPITLFEIETVAALWLFAQHPADILLLEVGLGGRLDATNVVEHPLACVLTPIGIDHTEFLGPTLADIAAEKAGILRRGAPVIVAEQDEAALAVIEREARRQRAPLFARGQQWHVQLEHGRLAYQDERGLMDLTAPKLFGRHQIDNAGLAIATLRAQTRFAIDQAAYQTGLLAADWPARMQRLTVGKLLQDAPQGCELWLDGAHNADGGRVAAAALGDLEERVSRPLVLIAGMMANKDAAAFLTNFTGLTRHLIAVPIPNREGAMPPESLADAGRALGLRVELAEDVPTALRRIASLAYELPPRILITGSLYLAGHVLELNGTPPN